MACAVWIFVGADLISPGARGRYSGFQKGNDFVQFYVAGTLAREGHLDALADPAAFRAAQAAYFRAGDEFAYPPVYGPHVALFFAPLASLSYLTAYAVWVAFTLALAMGSVIVLSRLSQHLRPWPIPVVAATLAFAPLGYLVLDGQLSALALASLSLAALALVRNRRLAAGAALGLLGYKLSLFAPALGLCLIAGEWTLAAAALAVASLQLAVVVPAAGFDPLLNYARTMQTYAASPDLLARNAFLMASLRTFWAPLLPSAAAKAAYSRIRARRARIQRGGLATNRFPSGAYWYLQPRYSALFPARLHVRTRDSGTGIRRRHGSPAGGREPDAAVDDVAGLPGSAGGSHGSICTGTTRDRRPVGVARGIRAGTTRSCTRTSTGSGWDGNSDRRPMTRLASRAAAA